MRHCFPLLLCLAFLVSHASPSLACRYTVRDVAFVDLGGAGYQLFAFADKETNADWRNQFNVMTAATFVDTNVQPTLIDMEKDPDHEAIDFLKATQVRGQSKLPAMILVSPVGKVLNLSTDSLSWESVAAVIQSPSREAILKPIFESYAVVILVEGKDKASNDLARESIQSAIKQIDAIRHEMPKPVKVGPKIVTIKAADRAKEKVLLWSLGVDAKVGDDPSVIVVLGRGRRIGAVISGPAVLQTDVFDVLNVIGQDCECGLDRKWMQGVSFPATFGDDYHASVKEQLGFNPKDEAVIAEMNRILSRGPVPAADLAIGIPRTAERLDPLLGYSETTVGQPSEGVASATDLNNTSPGFVSPNPGVIHGDPSSGGSDSTQDVWRTVGIVFGILIVVAIVGSLIVRRRAISNSSVT